MLRTKLIDYSIKTGLSNYSVLHGSPQTCLFTTGFNRVRPVKHRHLYQHQIAVYQPSAPRTMSSTQSTSSNSNPTKEILENHSSVRTFKNEPLSAEVVKRLVQTAQMVASSSFRQCYSLVWLRDKEKAQKVGVLADNESQFNTADASFVVCVDFARLKVCCEMNGVDMKHDCAENLLIGVVDASIFAQNLVVAAEAEGYGICYIGGVRNNIAEISELLQLPDLVFPLFGLTIGVPADGSRKAPKPRLPVEAILHEDSYDLARYQTLLPAYDKVLGDYYASKRPETAGSNKSDAAAWTGVQAKSLIALRRPHMKAFLASKGFTFA